VNAIVFKLRLSAVIISEMAKDKKSVDPTLAGFYEVMERTNVEKIINEMLAALCGDSSDSENFDVERERICRRSAVEAKPRCFWEVNYQTRAN
jgi:hypothetical protein